VRTLSLLLELQQRCVLRHVPDKPGFELVKIYLAVAIL